MGCGSSSEGSDPNAAMDAIKAIYYPKAFAHFLEEYKAEKKPFVLDLNFLDSDLINDENLTEIFKGAA